MPGAPNRPPETTPEATPVAAPAESPAERALRRLAPSRVALLLDVWKGAPGPDLLVPFEKAEAAYTVGDFENATNALDLLSVRLTEPRWPTLPEPFRRLRVSIPAPVPPHWDPEHALSPADKETRRARKVADDQLALADASIAWAQTHGVDCADLTGTLREAGTVLSTEGASEGFYSRIDGIWKEIRGRTPLPGARGPRPPAPATGVPTPEGA